MRAIFVGAGLGKVGRTRLQCGAFPRDSDRHFAGCVDDGSRIVVAPEIVDLPDETVAAILSHEFGHASDFAYPGRFVLVDDVAEPLLRYSTEADDRTLYNQRMQWERRDHDVVERTADAIAEWAYRQNGLERKIAYAGSCMLQTFGGGTRPRPAGLE